MEVQAAMMVPARALWNPNAALKAYIGDAKRIKKMERLILSPREAVQWVESMVPTQHLSDDRNLRKGRLLVFFYLSTAGFLLVFIALYALVGYWLGVWACSYGAVVVPLLLYIFHRTGSFAVTTGVFNFNAIFMFSLLIYGTGGIDSSIVPWLAIVPASGFVFDGWRRGLLMSLVCLAEIVVLFVLKTYSIHLPHLYDTTHTQVLNFAVHVGLVGYIFMILTIYEVSRERTIQRLDRLNADLARSKEEVEAQREALAESNAHIATINAGLEQEVASRTAGLVQAKKELDTFLYEAAHALRRPIARIMGLTQILRELPGNPATAQTLHDHLDTSTLLMDQMLHKLIMVSELDTRPLDLQRVPLSLLVEKVATAHGEALHRVEADFSLDVPQEAEVVIDPFLLEVSLGYVLDNAIRYTAKTGRKPKVEVRGEMNAGHWRIHIEDNGLGIPDSQIGRVTEMFFRATEKVTGGGLGLYVVRRALERMGGTLLLKSELGVGTVATIEFQMANLA